MKYTKEERFIIGQRIYEGEITTAVAAERYNINFYTARDYLRAYKASIPQKTDPNKCNPVDKSHSSYEHMSKNELIDELIKAKIGEARAKKGYLVKGVGANKQFISINKENLK